MIRTRKFTELFRIVQEPENIFYAWLFFLCIVCFGLLIPLLGFYWDDLPYIYHYHTFGPAGFPEYVSFDRPFSAWIFMLTTSLFGYHPIGYHLLALLLRFTSAILFSKIIKILWPENHFFRFFSSSLFLVYPGFLQQPIALIYNHHLSVLCLFLLSTKLMLDNILREKKSGLLFVISIFSSFHLFSIENFATLELIRPILIYILLRQKKDYEHLLRRTFLYWLPYLVIFLVFLVWRIFIFRFPSYHPGFFEAFIQQPLTALNALFSRIPLDFYTSTFGAWMESMEIPTVSEFGRSATYLFWILIATGFALTFFFTVFMQHFHPSPKFSTKSHIIPILVGLTLFVLAGSIVWVLDLPLEIVFAWDRMTLAFIPATAVLFGAGLSLMDKLKPLRNMIFCLLISTAIGSNFQNGMAFKRDWESFGDFLWQLSWRIPDLQKNTAIIGSNIGFKFFSDTSLTPALNLVYREGEPSHQFDYLFYYTEVRLGLRIPEMEKNLPISQSQRSYYFDGNTSNVIAIRYKPPGCLHIMDNVYANSITNLNLSDLQVEEIRLSNLNRINPEPFHQPPQFLAGIEPQKSWCYFYQKADLARQFKQYDQIIKLGDDAVAGGFSPRIASEWLPFLEGYIWSGQWETARFISDQIYNAEGNYDGGLCYTIKRINAQPDFPYKKELSEFIKVYNCL